MLIYRLPSNDSRARVAVWRELRRSGALHVQQSVVAGGAKVRLAAAMTYQAQRWSHPRRVVYKAEAQLLPNGNYHFDAGFLPDPANPVARISQALEVDASGNIVWGMQINAQEYRSFRLNDLYTPPLP